MSSLKGKEARLEHWLMLTVGEDKTLQQSYRQLQYLATVQAVLGGLGWVTVYVVRMEAGGIGGWTEIREEMSK